MRFRAALLILTVTAAPLLAQQPHKTPLDHAAYDIWRDIDNATMSADGRWLMYDLTLQDGDPELNVHGLDTEAHYIIPRATGARFTDDGAFVVFTIKSAIDSVRAARRKKVKREDLPKDTLGVLDLSSGDLTRVPNLEDFKLGDDATRWLAYRIAASRPDSAEADSGNAASKGKGATLTVRDLKTGEERSFPFVTAYSVSDDGARVAFVSGAAEDSLQGVYTLDPTAGSPRQLLRGPGDYRAPVFDEEGSQVAFLGAPKGDAESQGDEDSPEEFRLYYAGPRDALARVLAGTGTAGIHADWTVSEHRTPSFSRDGQRVFFGTGPRPGPAPKDTLLDEEKVTLDVWNWKDPYIQPMQLLQVSRERNRSYLAVVEPRDGRAIQLAREDMPDVSVGTHGNADVALGSSVLPYRQIISWDADAYRDVWLVNVRDGTRRLLLERTQSEPNLSPNARYVYWYDYGSQAWLARAVDGERTVNLTGTIAQPMHQVGEDHSWPHEPYPYGRAGWTADDGRLLVYDEFDIWALDPSGRTAPQNVTDGVGRERDIQFRYQRLDREEDAIDPDRPILLSAFQRHTKDAGFFHDRVRGSQPPTELMFAPRRFSGVGKAENADRLWFRRSDVDEFPDLWVSDLQFGNVRRVSDANPQQSDYNWATVELVEWRTDDGIPLQGLLYKPEDYDPSKQYPLMVNFYEQDSDNLHAYFAPVPHRSVIRPVFYASRGYMVFMPDIHYEIGYPGESAVQSVVPGVLALIRQGLVDPDRIGVQGHSWGGYQIAYMVTRTNLFAAAEAGAPVSDMVSAYGGIRWDSGLSRMFQYEKDQSRIGGSLWEMPLRYLENSPIFWADRVETPLLMLHNDHDGAVPWYQGIEMFLALRRLGKPAWLINYNDEVHWPQTFAERRDWNIRMQQFFDHYLMGAPAPVWLEEGIPAIEKGRTLGLDLVEPKSP